MNTFKSRLHDFRTFAEELLFSSRWTLPLLLLLLGAAYGRWLIDVGYTNDQSAMLESHPLSLIKQQRWGFSILGLLGLMDRYIPFWSTFIGLAIFTGAGVLFAYYWRQVAPRTFSHRQLLFGLGIFLVFPLNCEILVYPAAFVWNGVCYALIAVALLLSHEEQPQFPARILLAPRAWLLPAMLLAIAIATYESFFFVYLVSLILTILLRLQRNEVNSGHDLLIAARKPLMTLFAAVIIRSVVIFVLGFVTSYAEHGGGAAKTIDWFDVKNIHDVLLLCLKCIKQFIYHYLFHSLVNVALPLFWAVFIATACYFLKRVRRLFVVTLLFALFGALFGLTIMMGNIQPYRNCQAFAVLVGCLLPIFLVCWIRFRPLRILLAVGILFLCTKQNALFFDADHRAWQRVRLDYQTLAYDLQSQQVFQKGKPVYFVGYVDHGASFSDSLLPYKNAKRLSPLLPSPYQHAALTHFPADSIGRVILRDLYGITGIPNSNPNDLTQAELFALVEREQIPAFPIPGYIHEFDDKILIRVGASKDPSIPTLSYRQRIQSVFHRPRKR